MVKLSTSNPRYDDVPLNIPPFQYSSDLGYWDGSMGAISDSSRQRVWLCLAALSLVVLVIVGFVLTSILVKPEVRRKPYNLFLIFLMIPDIIFSAQGPPIHIINFTMGKYVSVEVCKLQGAFGSFGLIANCQVNALIALEIHRMLKDSHGRKRYFPPSAREVSIRCLFAYFAVAIVSIVWALNFENLPARVFLTGGGTYCAPAPYDTNSALLLYLFAVPFSVTIPFGICVYVTVDVLRKGYLPKQGEGKRVLTMFFVRLSLVFVLFWSPFLFSIFVTSKPWFSIFGAIWSGIQGAVSAIAMLGKGDIRACAIDLWGKFSCVIFSINSELSDVAPPPELEIDDFEAQPHQDSEETVYATSSLHHDATEEDIMGATETVAFENEIQQTDP